jgi:formylglycine-generating enzyme required for sulfatase activity
VADRIIGNGPNTGKKFAECGIPDFSNPRSAHPALYDMHGKVWELCQDWFDARYYATSPTDDPAGAPEGSL